jgi:hypothetical protein
MLCELSRWMISRSEDSGKRLPRIFERHLRRCGACGEYARSVASLSSRLREERLDWLAKAPDFPSSFEGEIGELMTGPQAPRRHRLALRPVPAAATALVVVAAVLVLFLVVLREPPPSLQDRAAARAAIKRFSSAPEGLQGVLGDAESSLERERLILERSISSAVEYLQARLNIRIERKGTPKPL